IIYARNKKIAFMGNKRYFQDKGRHFVDEACLSEEEYSPLLDTERQVVVCPFHSVCRSALSVMPAKYVSPAKAGIWCKETLT
ncbi:MAG: hypothetical protein OXM55_02485, partial [Bdellovibrionales bacterium]|nr:hypothetical protein [Bdellovibrionales bacterium]